MSVKQTMVCDGCRKEQAFDNMKPGLFRDWVDARVFTFSSESRDSATIKGDFCSLECLRKAIQRAEDLL